MGLTRPDDVDDGEIPKEAGQSGLKSDESGDVLPGVWREREPLAAELCTYWSLWRVLLGTPRQYLPAVQPGGNKTPIRMTLDGCRTRTNNLWPATNGP